VPNSSSINARIDAFFAQFITPTTPGAAVIVIHDGQIIHQAAHGLADLDAQIPLTTDHGFHIASMSKQMTALAIMMLAEQGALAYAAHNQYLHPPADVLPVSPATVPSPRCAAH
jgi:CubicO group peptidase (beta-lactamase class C family)